MRLPLSLTVRFVGCLDGGARASYASTHVRRRWTTGKRLGAKSRPKEGQKKANRPKPPQTSVGNGPAAPFRQQNGSHGVLCRKGHFDNFIKQGKRSKRPVACLVVPLGLVFVVLVPLGLVFVVLSVCCLDKAPLLLLLESHPAAFFFFS